MTSAGGSVASGGTGIGGSAPATGGTGAGGVSGTTGVGGSTMMPTCDTSSWKVDTTCPPGQISLVTNA